jgi:hypothetical protein
LDRPHQPPPLILSKILVVQELPFLSARMGSRLRVMADRLLVAPIQPPLQAQVVSVALHQDCSLWRVVPPRVLTVRLRIHSERSSRSPRALVAVAQILAGPVVTAVVLLLVRMVAVGLAAALARREAALVALDAKAMS